MGKHFTEEDVRAVVGLLDGWSGKLSWAALCKACCPLIGNTPSRQTLAKFSRIAAAYRSRKKNDGEPRLLTTGTSQGDEYKKISSQRLVRLERENERLRTEIHTLLQQFVVWQYNAYSRGLSDQDLNRCLPSIDRGNTDNKGSLKLS